MHTYVCKEDEGLCQCMYICVSNNARRKQHTSEQLTCSPTLNRAPPPRTTNLVIMWARNTPCKSSLLQVGNCMCVP